MSRVGRKIIPVPKGVNITVGKDAVAVKGPKGELKREVPTGVAVALNGAELTVTRADDSTPNRAKHGMMRALLANMVKGVTDGFERKLEINGVGYRAALQGKNLQLQLGYAHDIVYPIPEGVAIAVPKPTEIVITGVDAQKVGQAAAEIRAFRKPEPYKGKGVKYSGEFIFRKEGKKK